MSSGHERRTAEPSASGGLTRREFVKASTGVVVGSVAAKAAVRPARGATRRPSESLRVGVIGCGGRGTGAAVDAMEADPGVRVVALADVFGDRLEESRGWLRGHEAFAARAQVTDDRCFTGFDAYRRLIETEVDVVILATPPHFRSIHLEEAVRAGKHVFMEKPVAVDPVGVRRVLASADMADREGLCIVAGTQRRHEPCYRAAVEYVRAGGIGRIVSARCAWNQGGLWVHEKRPEYSDMEWQLRNWLYFGWLSGDHIVEQHVHNLDVINWAVGSHPLRAVGMGGRQVRTGAAYGNVFDHFAVEYEYPGGVHLISTCRQIDGCAARVDEMISGTEGRLATRPGFAEIQDGRGEPRWAFTGASANPYVEEHKDLFRAIRAGEPVNEARAVAESTLTAIMGRMSAYTGKEVTWEQALGSTLDLSPPAYEFGPLAIAPVAVPGRTALE